MKTVVGSKNEVIKNFKRRLNLLSNLLHWKSSLGIANEIITNYSEELMSQAC